VKINTIILDLDDTLNCLTMTILGQLGADVLPYQYDRFPPSCGYDIIAAWSELTSRPKPSVPEFWEMVTEDIWATAPRSQQFWLLEWAATAVGRKNVIIATVPTKSGECLSGKYTWMMRHLPVCGPIVNTRSRLGSSSSRGRAHCWSTTRTATWTSFGNAAARQSCCHDLGTPGGDQTRTCF
jgi:hypothetical protein